MIKPAHESRETIADVPQHHRACTAQIFLSFADRVRMLAVRRHETSRRK
jgi:hypothetical protein